MFTYNNTKNINTSYKLFELNYSYYPYISYKKEVNLRFKSKLVKKLSTKLKILLLYIEKTYIILMQSILYLN